MTEQTRWAGAMKAPWRWEHTRENDYMDEDIRQRVKDGDRGDDQWFDLKDADGDVVAEYSHCGSHEIKMTREHAAVLEAAAEMFVYVVSRREQGCEEAKKILEGINQRVEEFNK
jgi:hypothetical protein